MRCAVHPLPVDVLDGSELAVIENVMVASLDRRHKSWTWRRRMLRWVNVRDIAKLSVELYGKTLYAMASNPLEEWVTHCRSRLPNEAANTFQSFGNAVTVEPGREHLSHSSLSYVSKTCDRGGPRFAEQ
jgi:hypothetical protein